MIFYVFLDSELPSTRSYIRFALSAPKIVE